MGLDMYLEGQHYFGYGSTTLPQSGGLPIKSFKVDLGYWRKHPNLHGFIVQTFAGGLDECQEIELDADDINKIINAIDSNDLPHTEGFFFGESDGSEQEEDLAIFRRALQWLAFDDGHSGVKSVIYQASW